jgi:hypothetical protein
MKLLRTIRLDSSDTFIFREAAEPGEWAIPGAFMFADVDPEHLKGKERSAFRSGFLGIPSLGWSTLAQIVEVDADGHAAAVDALARCLCDRLGAPDFITARCAAEEEVAFAASLYNPPADTLIALQRDCENPIIRERFRTLRPRGGPKPLRAFSFLEVEGDDEPAETFDLAKLADRDCG